VPQVMWHVTDRCPLGCEYCFATKSGADFRIEHLNGVLSNLSGIGVIKIDVSGGEPLIHPQLPEIISAIAQRGVYQTITTSGVGYSSNRDYVMANLDLFTRVIVSLDAPLGQEHNLLRAFPKAWEMAIGFIERLPTDIRSSSLRINTVVTSSFVSGRWAGPMGDVVESVGAKEWCLIQPHPANKKSTFEKYEVADADFRSVVAEVNALEIRPRRIERPRQLYSKYWVLYPSGMLAQHTTTEERGASIDLIQTDKADLVQFVEHSFASIPTKGAS